MTTLCGKTMIVSGGSRGIGLAIALRVAADGANVTLLAKTAEPHPKLDGTVYTAAERTERAGGHALPIVSDVRDEASVAHAVEATIEKFGGIDIVLNNASAIDLRRTTDIDMKRYDLMQDINCRGTFLLSKYAIPHLRAAANAHILTLAPPINLAPKHVGANLAYAIAKYGMSLTTIGFAAELRDDGIAANSLWPRTLIATAAVRNLLGGDEAMAMARKPAIMADAAYAIVTRSSRQATGNFYIDDAVLAEEGITDLSAYRYASNETELIPDIFLD
jgi:citronellol/citronellal dehydrogenase